MCYRPFWLILMLILIGVDGPLFGGFQLTSVGSCRPSEREGGHSPGRAFAWLEDVFGCEVFGQVEVRDGVKPLRQEDGSVGVLGRTHQGRRGLLRR